MGVQFKVFKQLVVRNIIFGTDGTFFVRDLPGAPTAKRPIYFSQWANTYFSGGSFGETGCVPTSIAMVLNGSYGVN